MSGVTPESITAAREALGIPSERFPASVAIIMDGNGRWARSQNMPRQFGHKEGSKQVHPIVKESARLGLAALTLYSFSSENWLRPAAEVNTLMHLYAEYLVHERPTLMKYNVRLRHLGRREGLPAVVVEALDESIRVSSKNTGMTLCMAINYGSRAEVAEAVRGIARQVAEGRLKVEEINESTISDSFSTAGIPDPDLLIRTAGEMRVSEGDNGELIIEGYPIVYEKYASCT